MSNKFYTINFTIRGHINIRGDISPSAAYNCARAQLECLDISGEMEALNEVLEFEPAFVDLHEIMDEDGDECDPDDEVEEDGEKELTDKEKVTIAEEVLERMGEPWLQNEFGTDPTDIIFDALQEFIDKRQKKEEQIK